MVNFVPVNGVATRNNNRYIEELKKFMSMNVKMVKTDYNHIYYGSLKTAIKKTGLPVNSFSREKVIYLERTDMQ